jgi:crossover junction endodeoxyribonuclease RuvC
MSGDRSLCICSGCIKTPDGALAIRLKSIHDGLQRIIQDFEPLEMAIESVFVHRNVESALKLGQARGTAIAAIAINNLPVYEYTPAAIKKSVVGRGNAAKAQVQHMVKTILGLSKSPQSDAADALAVALCHGHTRQTLQQTELLRGMRRKRWR